MVFEWRPLTNEEIKWIGVDFDETLCHNTGFPNFIPTEPVKGAVEAMKAIDAKGYKITVFTARHWTDYHNIEGWLNHHGIPFRRIICGKPLLRWMIDDRNVEFDGDWDKVLNKIK
jgi:hypothetical protein